MTQYLQKRRRRWYAVLEIPRTLRKSFGRSRFVRSLETESLTEAERRVHIVVAGWKSLIHAKQTGKPSDDAVQALQLHQAELKAKGWDAHEIRTHQQDLAEEFEDNELYVAALVVHGDLVQLNRHVDEYLNGLDVEPKTRDMQRSDLLRFSRVFPYSEDVSRKKVSDWVTKTLINEEGLSASTCRRIISTCRGYWRWLEDTKGIAEVAPFEKVVPSARKKKSKQQIQSQRKAFQPSDYQKLLRSCMNSDPQLADLITLGAYTGCRIEELCSLTLENTNELRLRISDAKTAAGWREVPTHPHIVDLIGRLRASSYDDYLLSGLTFNKYGDRSNAIGKRFGRLKTRAGYGADYVFHSFRKGVATQLEAAGIPENVAARLLGHEFFTMSYGVYSDGLPLRELSEALRKVDWTL